MDIHIGIPTGENHIPIPMGMGIHMGVPTEILWEWEWKFPSHGNPESWKMTKDSQSCPGTNIAVLAHF